MTQQNSSVLNYFIEVFLFLITFLIQIWQVLSQKNVIYFFWPKFSLQIETNVNMYYIYKDNILHEN